MKIEFRTAAAMWTFVQRSQLARQINKILIWIRTYFRFWEFSPPWITNFLVDLARSRKFCTSYFTQASAEGDCCNNYSIYVWKLRIAKQMSGNFNVSWYLYLLVILIFFYRANNEFLEKRGGEFSEYVLIFHNAAKICVTAGYTTRHEIWR